MRVIDLIHSNKHTAFSFEILPPLKGTGIEKLYQGIDVLREFDPKYINITTHRSEYVYQDYFHFVFILYNDSGKYSLVLTSSDECAHECLNF